MKYYVAMIDEVVIVRNVSRANSFLRRLRGLLFKKDLKSDEGLIIYPCNQIHTFGMKFQIDAVFLSPFCKIVHIEHNMEKGKISRYVKGANQVLELKGGTVKEKNISIGQTIIFTR